MDGRNSSGKIVSLLNSDVAAPAPPLLPFALPPLLLRTPSTRASTPSPHTPSLACSDSCDSPFSPQTPRDSIMDPRDYYYHQQPQQPQPQSQPQQPTYQPPHYPPHAHPAYAPPPVAIPAPPSGSAKPARKSHYPCPMAKQFGCTDFFTTSGHAARHAKKHTGKKDAFCPECSKAFTRKDNMEQHRRTHQTGRASSRPAESRVAKSKKPAKKPGTKPDEIVINPPVASSPYYAPGSSMDPGPVPPLPMAAMDPKHPQSHHRGYQQHVPLPPPHGVDFSNPPSQLLQGDPALHYPYPSPGQSAGLDNLARAASQHRHLESASVSP
ncbi:hypothetical protein K470DRAFT_268727 [Piedraia hortae CBS 480.64]|uniref:C2H2 type master regulator of conidiophore development brlA n=1 Tax=Piedraia hortae CBS 480.64 TaxID=1314780 RepID=A0A6A7C689_9PEZI|nr:hypothetical protein K470DRAFT_268727 [Piedraia hortae CBS 480.64]